MCACQVYSQDIVSRWGPDAATPPCARRGPRRGTPRQHLPIRWEGAGRPRHGCRAERPGEPLACSVNVFGFEGKQGPKDQKIEHEYHPGRAKPKHLSEIGSVLKESRKKAEGPKDQKIENEYHPGREKSCKTFRTSHGPAANGQASPSSQSGTTGPK